MTLQGRLVRGDEPLATDKCGRCGAFAEAGDRFCAQCGGPLGGCPACGGPIGPGDRFCRSCGEPLPGSAAARRPAGPLVLAAPAVLGGDGESEPVAERRVCSVLFCDFVGFTPLSEQRDPEAVRELLSDYFEVARTVVGRYGGVIEKFIGDAVMAAWGAPVAAEGDAERAVRAGLDLVAAVAQLGLESGVPGLAARAGVVTGEVAVTMGVPGEGMLAGDAVNTASRIQAAAQPGQVLADAATQRLADGGVGFESAGEHQLKGKAEPVPLWRATRVLASIGGAQRVDGLEAPLVGRDAELRTVRELFHAAAARRMPRLVLVSGPAGVGKSRLGWEFEKYVDGLADTVWWHRGRCLSYGDGVAFWALAEIVRQRLGIAEEETAQAAAAKLAAGLDRYVTDPVERAYAAIRVGRLLGVSVDGDSAGQLSREELFAGWRLFFERLAADAPVVLVVEDAQHADSGLLDFLDHLIDWSRNLPIYVLVLARPELDLARQGFGTGRNRTTLTLDPLDPASMDKLVGALVPGMPAAALAKVTSHAQGIPLFAVETVRSLIDRDIVQPSGGEYRLIGDVGELAVPDSLHALFAARLDALDKEVRRLATDAAVLGTSFSAEALVALSGREDAPVRAALAELVRREVLSVSADPLSPERGSYQFAQQMLRQVAYDTLSRRDRKARHLAVAAHLRAAFAGDGEEVADVIARHYRDALEAVPDDPDAAEIRGQAAAALVRAAERANRTGAPAMAGASYAAAAELTALGVAREDQPCDGDAVAGPDAGTLWERAARLTHDGGDSLAAIDYASRARDSHQRRGDARAAARARCIAGECLRAVGRHCEARAELTEALAVLRAEPDVDTVRALARLASLETWSGSPDADRLTTEALILGQALRVETRELIKLFLHRAICLLMQDRRPEAAAYLRENVRLATEVGDTLDVGLALLNLADAEADTDAPAAADHARAAAGQLRRAGASRYLAFAIANLAQALLMLGDWGGAEAELASVDADGLAAFDYVVGYRGLLAALRGDIVTAEICRDGLGDLRASEDAQDKTMVGIVEAFIAVACGQREAALRQALDTLSLADTLGMTADNIRWAWPLAVRTAWDLGDGAATAKLLGMIDARQPGQVSPLLWAERDLARARLAARDGAADDEFAVAIRGLRDHGTPYHLAHGLLDQAQYLADHKDPDTAAVAVGEAQAIAEKMCCRPLLDRVDKLARATSSVSARRAPGL
jgi:class 3 adenylate cyclase/tetratricopeptide (TPR) repeat protein